MNRASTILLLALICRRSDAAELEDVAAAAKTHYPAATWQAESVLTGDFTCEGREEFAILGTSSEFIVIAVFTHDLTVMLEILKYSAKARVAEWAVLRKESRDFTPEEIKAGPGYVPEGWTPSETCSDLNLTDNNVDSAHIYWDTTNKRFADWVL